MKQKIIISLIYLLIISIGSHAQVRKVYAYKQASIPGILPEFSDEKVKKPEHKQTYNYWFYIATPKTANITITGLWVSGNQYNIKIEKVNDLPVEKIVLTGLEKNDTILLVPVTSNKVILVYPAGEKPGSAENPINLSQKNELVLRYTWKGKTYYTGIKKIKELAPDVRV